MEMEMMSCCEGLWLDSFVLRLLLIWWALSRRRPQFRRRSSLLKIDIHGRMRLSVGNPFPSRTTSQDGGTLALVAWRSSVLSPQVARSSAVTVMATTGTSGVLAVKKMDLIAF